MNGFKERLQRELKQDVPFTDDVKRRLLQPKRDARPASWRIALVSVVACSLAILLFSTLLFPQNKALQLANEGKELLPIVQVAEGKVIEPAPESTLLGEQWMLQSFPMVIDEDAPITYGDHVAYYMPSGIFVSTVLGLENDSVTMNEGQIIVNYDVLTVHGLGEKIVGATKKNVFTNPYYVHEWETTFSPFTNETIQLVEDELIVYKYNLETSHHELQTIKKAQIAGKVTAIYAPDQLELTLTKEEQAVFDAFKIDHNLEHLRNISPIAITKMYLFSDIEQDYETYEALFTTVENEETLQVKTYYEKTKAVREKLFTLELNRLLIARYFNGIEQATFEKRSETEGWVVYTGENGLRAEAGMLKNEQGIWQPAFERGIYFPLD